ncbi:hypothetical protein [Haloarchaeobius amylolyticus]|uniref:hypothetical protein n=1 Tax=Haloarchaeobius amylolyticus TaxID=1198296 RepID=UPI0022722000|nr:hypothetical protein [Haloarchaeobius amylolyticus]
MDEFAETSRLDLAEVDRTLALFPTRLDSRDRVQLHAELRTEADGPPRLRAIIENQGDHPRPVILGDLPFEGPNRPVSAFAGGTATGENHSLWLLPTENHAFFEHPVPVERASSGVWRATDHPNQGWAETPRQIMVDPGERVVLEYHLLVGPDEDRLLPGRYRFRGFPGGETRIPRFDAMLAIWETSAPGPSPDGDSRFAGTTFPPVPLADETAWFHDATPETPVYLRPSTERAQLPAAIEFTLVNRGNRTLFGNQTRWVLYELVDGVWESRSHHTLVDVGSPLWPGDAQRWRLRARADTVLPCDPDRPAEPSVGDLAPGTYAFWVEYSPESCHDGFGAVVELVE